MNDPDGKMGALPLDLSGGFMRRESPLDLFFVADASETEASLSASEGASFTLGDSEFHGPADGPSPLTLSNVVLSNWNGDSTLAGVASVNGKICVRMTRPAVVTAPNRRRCCCSAARWARLAIIRRRRHGVSQICVTGALPGSAPED